MSACSMIMKNDKLRKIASLAKSNLSELSDIFKLIGMYEILGDYLFKNDIRLPIKNGILYSSDMDTVFKSIEHSNTEDYNLDLSTHATLMYWAKDCLEPNGILTYARMKKINILKERADRLLKTKMAQQKVNDDNEKIIQAWKDAWKNIWSLITYFFTTKTVTSKCPHCGKEYVTDAKMTNFRITCSRCKSVLEFNYA